MDHDAVVVGSRVHVQLNHVRPPPRVGIEECRECVFWHEPAAATMRNQQRPAGKNGMRRWEARHLIV
jgi:hypothetical protein